MSLSVGDHTFKGQLVVPATETEQADIREVEFIFTVEAGGIISSQPTATHNYSLNGIVQEGKLTLKQTIEHLKEDIEFDGEFENEERIVGTFKKFVQNDLVGLGTFQLVRDRPSSAAP